MQRGENNFVDRGGIEWKHRTIITKERNTSNESGTGLWGLCCPWMSMSGAGYRFSFSEHCADPIFFSTHHFILGSFHLLHISESEFNFHPLGWIHPLRIRPLVMIFNISIEQKFKVWIGATLGSLMRKCQLENLRDSSRTGCNGFVCYWNNGSSKYQVLVKPKPVAGDAYFFVVIWAMTLLN